MVCGSQYSKDCGRQASPRAHPSPQGSKTQPRESYTGIVRLTLSGYRVNGKSQFSTHPPFVLFLVRKPGAG